MVKAPFFSVGFWHVVEQIWDCDGGREKIAGMRDIFKRLSTLLQLVLSKEAFQIPWHSSSMAPWKYFWTQKAPTEFWFFSQAAILVKAQVSKKTLKGGKIIFCDYRLILLSVNLSLLDRNSALSSSRYVKPEETKFPVRYCTVLDPFIFRAQTSLEG